jgi:hypothetical protein
VIFPRRIKASTKMFPKSKKVTFKLTPVIIEG